MAKIPIDIQKITVADYKNTAIIKYLVTVVEKGASWNMTAICDRQELLKLRDELNQLLAESTTSEILKITEEKALIVDKAHKNDMLCNVCEFKMTSNCVTCLFELQSPLERKLFLELKRANIYFKHQYPLNWQGKKISIEGRVNGDPQYNFREVLTIADFYISERGC